MLPRKISYFSTLVLLFVCAIKDSASQEALGRFQDLPVNCYDCTGSECVDSFPGRINRCTGDVNQSCATVFGPTGIVTARGCSGAVAESCNEATNNCYYCQSSGCNIATVETDYIDCIDCDTERDVNCLYNLTKVTSTRKCLKTCITTLYARDRTSSNPAYELARTCLDDYDLDERELCEAGNLENCKPCTTASCNTENVPATPRLRCLICEGENCEEPEELECSSYRSTDQCFVQFDELNDVSRMGCMSSLEDAYVAENKRRIYTCDGDVCNTYAPVPSTCAACNSLTDKNCVTQSFGTAQCNVFPFTQCATYLQNGNVVRDCVSNVESDALFDKCLSDDNSECQICTGNSCNVDIFPADRQSCVICDASKDINCDSGSDEYAGYCTTYKQGDVCVTSVENGLTRRGCGTDVTCDDSDTKTCRTCTTKDCNTVNLLQNDVGVPGKWQDLPLSCNQCVGAACLNETLTQQSCTGNNLQTCMTVFDATNVITMRGCSDAVEAQYNEYCETNPDKCFKCKSNNCNDATAIAQYIDCYFCDSDVVNNCAVDFIGGRTRKCKNSCMVSLFPTSLTADPAYETSRSCLDDLEKTAQDTCRNGESTTCSACTTSLCNKETLPADRLECLKCVDDKCLTTASSKCGSYMENDQCYALFENSSKIELGCRSDLVADTVELLIKEKKLWVCDTNNCNQDVNFPKPQSCLVCNSANDLLCATNPSALTTMETCAETPYTECVTQISDSGNTVRDCLSSLAEDDFYACQTGSDALCQKCLGDNCNVNIFPENRLQCQNCDSANDDNCATAPNSLAVCPLYDANDKCVSTVVDTYTHRGCSSSIKCADENDRAACRICDTAGCNTVNLEKNFAQGSPGRWQDLPISCYTCNSATECTTLGTATACSVDKNQQCLTVFNSAGAVIQRGCGDTVLETQETYCDENVDKCLACNSNSCNMAKAETDYVDCVYCDTDRNGDCVNDVANIKTTRKCYQQCMTALYPRADETDPAYGLSRSCLDDQEQADREACINGENANCKACAGGKCNTVALPETRFSCLHCENENCDEPKEQLCAQHRANDKCYIQFDETYSIVRLGCRSDFANTEADYLLSQKRLLYCDGENCNDLETVPLAQTCTLCNSRTEANCASNPSEIDGATSCAVLPYTDCYTRVLEDGATERGCLSSLLDDEFTKCLANADADSCKTCTGNRCNKELFPAERLSCHICDSTTNTACEANPNSLTICPVYDQTQSCVSSVKNGVTIRGCSADIVCDPADTSICETCSGDGCNTENVARKVDNNYGKWQDLPLTCWDCTGDDCKNTAAVKEQKCALNNLQDCVTVFDATNAVVRRGCSDDVNVDYKTWCDQNPDKCPNCKSNKCNSVNADSTFVNCVYCDSNTDLTCLSAPSNLTTTRKCQGSCMTALYPLALSKVPSYATIRTCLNDKESADQLTCSAGKDVLCSACTTDNCNVNPLPATRLSCYQCNGENCDEPETGSCPLYREIDQCFTLFDEFNSITEMGCVSSFNNLELEELVALKRFLICDGDNCNSMDTIPNPQQCIVCDSSVDPLCVTNAGDVATLKTCTALPYTNCYTSVFEDGFTRRGCVSDLEEEEFTDCVLSKTGSCKVCEGDGCNNEIFPADRLQCYTCDSTEDSSCDSDPTKTEICSVFTPQTTCVTALLGTNVTVRGCSFDVLCDSNDRTTCRSCSETGCNSIQLKDKVDDGYHGVWQDLPLKCYTCKGDQCLSSLGVSSECTGNDKQDCMTVFNKEGDVVRRGCSDEVEDYEDRYCRQNPSSCFTCKSNDCNVAWNTTDFVDCLFCDSAKDPECASHPANVNFPTRACYKECMVASKGQSIIRSCLDDKDLYDQASCRTDSEECDSCNTDGCNNFAYPRERISCHVCSNSACTSSTSEKCTGEPGDEFCFAKYESNAPVLLGCASTQDVNELALWASENRLFSCMESNCNAISKLPTAISCVHCNSTAECAQNPGQVKEMSKCNPLLNQCYSLIEENGKTSRGCVSDLDLDTEYQCIKDGTCETCESNKCNNKIYPENRRSCYICKSSEDTNCYEKLTSGFSQVCPIYEANDSCVTRIVNGLTERGCGSELDCDTNDLSSCIMCSYDNCNTVKLEENNNNNGGNNSASLAGFNLLNTVLALGFILVLNKIKIA